MSAAAVEYLQHRFQVSVCASSKRKYRRARRTSGWVQVCPLLAMQRMPTFWPMTYVRSRVRTDDQTVLGYVGVCWASVVWLLPC